MNETHCTISCDINVIVKRGWKKVYTLAMYACELVCVCWRRLNGVLFLGCKQGIIPRRAGRHVRSLAWFLKSFIVNLAPNAALISRHSSGCRGPLHHSFWCPGRSHYSIWYPVQTRQLLDGSHHMVLSSMSRTSLISTCAPRTMVRSTWTPRTLVIG